MNIKTAIVEAQKAAAAGLPVLLLGSPGVGKTAVASVLAFILKMPYKEIRVAEFEAVDFRGIPSIENGRTKWNPPDFWPAEACVLNFDEITQAPMELTSPLLKIFLGGEIGDYKLPEGTILIATGNLVSDRAGCSRISSALRERCVVINIEPDLSDWLDWFAGEACCDSSIIDYLKANPAAFHKWDGRADFNQPTPRNWARVARLLKHNPVEETLAGIIGNEQAKAFVAWRRANVRLPEIVDVLDGREKMPTNPAMASRFVDCLADYCDEVCGNGETADVEKVVEFMLSTYETYQIQFLRRLAKLKSKALKSLPVSRMVKVHAKAIVESQK